MSLSATDVSRIARLARLHMDESEIAAVQGQLNGIFGLIEAMQAVDTTGVAPMSHPQDVSLRPTFGTLDLRENFQPDPRSIDVTAGGTLNAERLGNGCTGSIANPPDVRLNYEAGRLPLYISENGLSCNDKIYRDGQVHDADRIDFLARFHRADLRGEGTA